MLFFASAFEHEHLGEILLLLPVAMHPTKGHAKLEHKHGSLKFQESQVCRGEGILLVRHTDWLSSICALKVEVFRP